MIVGIGVDIISVERIRGIVQRQGDRFLQRVYTDEEVAYCRRSGHPEQRFASRFAAKEAVLKALGVGWRRGTTFRDVRVSNNDLGAPSVQLSGRTLEISRELGVSKILISLSHDEKYAVAQAVAEAD